MRRIRLSDRFVLVDRYPDGSPPTYLEVAELIQRVHRELSPGRVAAPRRPRVGPSEVKRG